MISPRWKKIARDLWLHKSRTGMATAAICVGIIGSGAVLNTWSLVRRATRMEYEASRPPSAVLRTGSLSAEQLGAVRTMAAVEAVQLRRVQSATVQTPSGNHTALLVANESYDRNDIGVLKPERGSWPPHANNVAIERSSMDFAELGLGDSVALRIGDGPSVRAGITSVVRDVGVAPGWMEHVVYLFITPELLTSLGSTSVESELQILVRDRALTRAAIRRVADDVRQVLEQRGAVVREVSVPIPGRHIHAAQIDSLLYTQGAFALLALLLSGVLVINLVSAMLTGQVREIGIMKSIGARSSQIAGMYLALALVLGVIACTISVPLAAIFGRLYATFTAELLNFDVSAFAIPWWSFASQVAVGLLLPVVAAAIPVSRGCRIPVGEALRDLGISPRREHSSSWLLSHSGDVSRPLLLSLRNTFRKRQRLALTLGTLSLGGAVFLGAIDLRAAIVQSVDLLFAPQKFDLSFRIARPAPADSLVLIAKSLDGVTAAEAWRGSRAIVSAADGQLGTSFSLVGPPADTRMLELPLISGRWVAQNTNELVVNRRLLEEAPEIAVGKSVSLVVSGTRASWLVVGLAEAGPGASAWVSRGTIERVSKETGATTLVVATSVPPGGARLDLIRKLRETLSERGYDVVSSQSIAQQRVVIEDHLLLVASFLGNMSMLMIIVGGLALASTMSLGVLERTREIGVMRAIGASHRAILAIVQVEGLVIAVLSWLIAIPLSVPMSVALEMTFGSIMLPVPITVVPEPAGVLRWLALVVVVALTACAWPALRATRITTASALSYE